MIENSHRIEKNSDTARPWLAVVAGALMAADGRCLMHQRPVGKMYAGLWEFPGGKVEAHEKPVEALVRELREELGISVRVDACRPALLAEQPGVPGGLHIVLMLYTVSNWSGTARAVEGGAIGWFAPAEARALAMPPMDRDLAGRLWR